VSDLSEAVGEDAVEEAGWLAHGVEIECLQALAWGKYSVMTDVRSLLTVQ
jgi:hypothetical protein